MGLHPHSAESHLNALLLDSSLEIDCFGVLWVKKQGSLTGLLPGYDFNMELSTFIDVADDRSDDDAPRYVMASEEVVGLSAEVDIVIETGLFDLFDQVRPRQSFGSVHGKC